MAFTGNSLANSTILTLPGSSVTDSVSTTNLFDTYRFTLAQGSQVKLTVSGLSANADVALIRDTNANNLVDSGEILASATNTGSLAELVSQPGLLAGSYFIQVALNAGMSTSYSLNLATVSQLQNDIIWRNSTTGDLGLWATTTTTTTATYDRTLALDAPLTPASWVVEGTGDFNGDGTDDVLLRKSDGSTQIQFMVDGKVSSSGAIAYQGATPPVSQSFIVAGVGDVDGDGKADIIWQNQTAAIVVVWRMDGATVTNASSLAFGASYKLNAVADFDQDGKADIYWREGTSGQSVYWYLDVNAAGATIIKPGAQVGLSVPMYFDLEGVGDFNGDGKTDMLWRNNTPGYTGSNVVMWLMNGTNYITGGADYITLNGSALGNLRLADYQMVGMRTQGTEKSAAVLRDWNGDGKADIVWRSLASGDVILWRMNGLAIDSGSTINAPGAAATFATTRQAIGLARRPLRLDESGSTTATALDLGSLNGAGNYAGLVSGLDNEDWFKFTLAASTSVNLALTGLTGNADLQLLNSAGGIVATSALTGTANETISQTLAAGSYFARVYTTGNVSSRYQLGVSAVLPADTQLPTITTSFVATNTSQPKVLVQISDDRGVQSLQAQLGINPPQTIVAIDPATGNYVIDLTALNGGTALALNATYTNQSKSISLTRLKRSTLPSLTQLEQVPLGKCYWMRPTRQLAPKIQTGQLIPGLCLSNKRPKES
jgi:Bacterial pre-peptidase C-terminal domain/FG-GAP-like repeat